MEKYLTLLSTLDYRVTLTILGGGYILLYIVYKKLKSLLRSSMSKVLFMGGGSATIFGTLSFDKLKILILTLFHTFF